MEDEGCSCDTAPEAHSNEAFCKDEAKTFKEEHKDDTFDEHNAAACSMG
jgi:hypothetical protein